MPEIKSKRDFNNSKLAGSKNIGLYLKIHIMPTLNRPLKGKPWHWIVPFIAAGILIVVFVYFWGLK
jgi:hypothetical protein